MKKFRSFIALTLVLALTTSTIYSQEPYNQENESYSSAYMQSSHTAHWSVYIPIAILVGAAIWFGMADSKRDRHHSSDSQDGLGSIANSKRHSAPSHTSSSYKNHHSKSSSASYSKGSYSH